jgi:hypothetical protein
MLHTKMRPLSAIDAIFTRRSVRLVLATNARSIAGGRAMSAFRRVYWRTLWLLAAHSLRLWLSPGGTGPDSR